MVSAHCKIQGKYAKKLIPSPVQMIRISFNTLTVISQSHRLSALLNVGKHFGFFEVKTVCNLFY